MQTFFFPEVRSENIGVNHPKWLVRFGYRYLIVWFLMGGALTVILVSILCVHWNQDGVFFAAMMWLALAVVGTEYFTKRITKEVNDFESLVTIPPKARWRDFRYYVVIDGVVTDAIPDAVNDTRKEQVLRVELGAVYSNKMWQNELHENYRADPEYLEWNVTVIVDGWMGPSSHAVEKLLRVYRLARLLGSEQKPSLVPFKEYYRQDMPEDGLRVNWHSMQG